LEVSDNAYRCGVDVGEIELIEHQKLRSTAGNISIVAPYPEAALPTKFSTSASHNIVYSTVISQDSILPGRRISKELLSTRWVRRRCTLGGQAGKS